MLKKSFLVIVLLIISGCTICEKPYIKVNGSCCLDENRNFICDEEEDLVEDNDEEYISEKDEKVFLIDYRLSDVTLESKYYKPFEQEGLAFFISSMDIKLVTRVDFEFKPMCKDDDLLHTFLNDRFLHSNDIKCGETQTFSIEKEDILVGENKIEFSTKNGPYMIKEGKFTIHFDGEDDKVQDIEKFVLETYKEYTNLEKQNKILIQNYHDLNFAVTDEEYIGDIELSFDVNDEEYLLIYLNNEEIFSGRVKDSLDLELPNDKINIGHNTVRYLVVP